MNAAKRKGTAPDREGVRDYVEGLQARICQALEAEEPSARFGDDPIDRGPKGFSRPRVLRSGSVIEQAAVNFTHTRGAELPASASQRRPELAGLSYEAISISLIVHPGTPMHRRATRTSASSSRVLPVKRPSRSGGSAAASI